MSDRNSPPSEVDNLTTMVAHALQRARDALLDQMTRMGLSPQQGWRIKEELRHTREGTEWILSPIHLREMPPGIEVRVRIDADGRLVPEATG